MGQKQTCALQQSMSALPPIATKKADMPQMVMSALPPKADSCSATAYVCFGPIADITSLFDHLIGAGYERWSDSQAERLGGLEVEDKFELGRLLDWQVGWPRTLDDLVQM